MKPEMYMLVGSGVVVIILIVARLIVGKDKFWN